MLFVPKQRSSNISTWAPLTIRDFSRSEFEREIFGTTSHKFVTQTFSLHKNSDSQTFQFAAQFVIRFSTCDSIFLVRTPKIGETGVARAVCLLFILCQNSWNQARSRPQNRVEESETIKLCDDLLSGTSHDGSNEPTMLLKRCPRVYGWSTIPRTEVPGFDSRKTFCFRSGVSWIHSCETGFGSSVAGTCNVYVELAPGFPALIAP